MIDLQKMSSNLITVISAMIHNQSLVNYVGHNGDNPESQTIDGKAIAPKGSMERIFPYPFDVEYKEEVRSQVHVYYPNIDFVNNSHASQTVILFDVIVHKDIWLVTNNNQKLIRPYQICKHIIDTFHDKRVGSLGRMHFENGQHVVVNEKFEGFRLVARITDF